MQTQPTDFINLLIELRDGQIAQDINEKFNEILAAVLRTAGKGKVTIEFLIEPAKMGTGGAVIEVGVEHDIKMKRPELRVGKAFLFVTPEGKLSRKNPDQIEMENFMKEQNKDGGTRSN